MTMKGARVSTYSTSVEILKNSPSSDTLESGSGRLGPDPAFRREYCDDPRARARARAQPDGRSKVMNFQISGCTVFLSFVDKMSSIN